MLFRSFWLPLTIASLFACTVASLANQARDPLKKHPLTERDIIEERLLPAPDIQGYIRDTKDLVGVFSPNGQKFVVLVRQGNLQRNTNDYSLLLFVTSQALHSPAPEKLLTFSSSSNRDAIFGVRWLADSETLVFLGEHPGETSQVWSFNIHTRLLHKLTNEPGELLGSELGEVTSFDISADGRQLVYLTAPDHDKISDNVRYAREGMMVGDNDSLSGLIAGYRSDQWRRRLHLRRAGMKPMEIVLPDNTEGSIPLLSPDGRYVALRATVMAPNLPKEWSQYNFGGQNAYIQSLFKSGSLLNAKRSTPFSRVWIIDTKKVTSKPLLNSPMVYDR